MISTRWLENPNQGRSHFPRNFWSSYEYLIQYQSEDSRARSMVMYVPPSKLTTEPRTVIIV